MEDQPKSFRWAIWVSRKYRPQKIDSGLLLTLWDLNIRAIDTKNYSDAQRWVRYEVFFELTGLESIDPKLISF